MKSYRYLILLIVGITFSGIALGALDQQVQRIYNEKEIRSIDAILSSVQSLLKVQCIQTPVELIAIKRQFLKSDQVLLQSSSQKLMHAGSIPQVIRESNFKVRKPLTWEFLSSVHEVSLYPLFTAVDLVGYPPNNPPYEPSNPQPQDGATNVQYDVTLGWTGGDPDPGDTVTYDLYFGDTSPPQLLAENLTATMYDMTGLDPTTVYYWQILARDNFGATTTGPIWTFTTQENYPPYAPVNPIPPDNGTDVDINANLSWQCNDPNPGDTLTYDVYFGTADPPPMLAGDLTESSFDLPEMDLETIYYWQVIARDNYDAETAGPVWTFTTSNQSGNNPPYEPSNPNPTNGATGVDINSDLAWDGGDPDAGDTVVYDVYFGTDSNPPYAAQGLTSPMYEPGTLQEDTLYYWRIMARDSHQRETEGPLWHFDTNQGTQPTPTPPPECTEYEVNILMPSDYFCPGDIFYLHTEQCNPESAQYLHLFVILDVYSNFFFAPSWTEFDYYYEVFPNGWSEKVVLDFVWPEVEGSASGINIYGAFTNAAITEILGEFDFVTFGYGPCN